MLVAYTPTKQGDFVAHETKIESAVEEQAFIALHTKLNHLIKERGFTTEEKKQLPLPDRIAVSIPKWAYWLITALIALAAFILGKLT